MTTKQNDNTPNTINETIMISKKAQEHILKQLGENIFNRRRAKNMLQIDLSKKVGLSRTSVSNIEVGRHKIDVITLYNLAFALECRVDELIPKIIF